MSDSRNVVLASASPSRKRLLETSGISAEIIVSGVDEEDPKLTSLAPKEMVIALAILKAHTVAKMVGNQHLVIGCDSTFEFNGKSFGKPLTPELAIARCKELRGNFGYLHTGHCIIDTKAGIEISDISTSKVFFADMTDGEIADYVASGEPLNVAGGFTLDGLSAPFISRIEGYPSGIIGLSLPLLRKAVNSLGLTWSSISKAVVNA
ncbi:Maf Nucleotide-binding protein implicated in inhibition of septum formation [actinobacterium SCGC AAA044-D11]